MEAPKRKAPIAANNQGGMLKTLRHKYRTTYAVFHFKKSHTGKGVIYANG